MAKYSETFRLITPLSMVHREDFPLTDEGLFDPTNANPLMMGEWLEFTSGSSEKKMARATNATVPTFACFGEKGRTDMQAAKKAPLLYMGPYIAESKIIDPAGSWTHGCKLKAATVVYESLNRAGLKVDDGKFVVGYCLRTPTNNGGWLRFIRTVG